MSSIIYFVITLYVMWIIAQGVADAVLELLRDEWVYENKE